ncbi:bifunctional 3-(3-hydroxy-phenyl)propionate/3-hydroxycinnamic acid hydroxylase [Streptomyces lacrimifluminis]|uniref:3-(3-hydroxy-phenyl)propionate/3-hydroxycinnamic acid hydroxylase n=1 Tax=Streptomyces lacrimifluminis TaxID=1500077 RepID=A0A917NV02_9ACTN|nr:bifunctional 3-(3-hydroxy-phenyl)propionate/3-hydroxycinnamic acid hydroxylase [Streptomyces lacrimifluminis]GGJ27550.1 3-(3-hydroxy-phenyl)propionate/3-hydroxycinnamic acid hydroxylase [Streptomyces lacrimifluminis]
MAAPPPASSGAEPLVLVVGAGPVGLTAANLLGALGVRVLVVERHTTTSDEAKAISLDDESLRTLQLAGLDEAVYPIIVPGTGTRYYGVGGRPLVHARGTGDRRYGHPFKNPFAQPDLERVLRSALDRFPHVDVRFGTRLVELSQYPDRVWATVASGDGDTGEVTRQIEAAYVLGCDGGRSTVRGQLAVPMRGSSCPDDVWLVVDTLGDPHDERYGMHVGDPDRPLVIVPGREGRCRYEFRLRPGECAPGGAVPFGLVRDLLRPHRDITPEQVERSVAYTFHALLAERLREGRCFLLGDAAHMMPPFAGQGLNSGVRDAANLCWKVAEVLAGRAADPLLDTYDTERRPHAQAVIELSVRLGRIVMTTDHRRARVRDFCVRAALRSRRGRRYLTEMRYRPDTRVRDGAVVPATGPGEALVGTLLRQPSVLHGPGCTVTRLDDLLGPGWSLLGIGLSDEDWKTVAAAPLPDARRVDVVLGDRAPRAREGRAAVADADGELDAYLASLPGRLLLVRPDRLIAAVFTPGRADHVSRAFGRFLSPARPLTGTPGAAREERPRSGTSPTPAGAAPTGGPTPEPDSQGARK